MALRKLVRHRCELPVCACSCNYAIMGTKLIFQPSEDTWTGTSLFHTTLALGFIMKAEVWRWIEVRFWFEWVVWVKVHKIMGNKPCSHKDIETTNVFVCTCVCVCVCGGRTEDRRQLSSDRRCHRPCHPCRSPFVCMLPATLSWLPFTSSILPPQFYRLAIKLFKNISLSTAYKSRITFSARSRLSARLSMATTTSQAWAASDQGNFYLMSAR